MSGALLNKPYLKSCTLEIANIGFRASAICPCDPNTIPEHEYINDLHADFAVTGSQANQSSNKSKVNSKAEPIGTNIKVDISIFLTNDTP